MRVPAKVHTANPWRIREIAHDFAIEDVWALPVHGDADDFTAFLDAMVSMEFPDRSSPAVRFLWWFRDRVGGRFGLGRIADPTVGADGEDTAAPPLPIPGTDERSLLQRLPADLRGTAPETAELEEPAPFVPLYLTADEYASELSNRTVHSVMHLAWAAQPDGRYRGEMTVYVKPRGALGKAYMALIKPFRYLVVYPALLRAVERSWNARPPASRQLTQARSLT